MDADLIVIGGGVAGLAAGIRARKLGLDTLILEQHSLPGGLCTSWQRGDYVFDGCLTYLLGAKPGAPFSDIWAETGVDGLEYVSADEMFRVQDDSGGDLRCWADPDMLEAELVALSPGDAALSKKLVRGIRDFSRFDLSSLSKKPRSMMSLIDWRKQGLSLLPFLPATLRWAFTSASDYASKYRDPFLRKSMPWIFGWGEIPMLAGLASLAALHAGNAGFPKGGSLALSRAMEKRYLELGGRILYGKRVDRILVEKQRVKGVRLFTDEDLFGRAIVAACDGRTLMYDMLEGRHLSGYWKKRYHERAFPVHTQIQLSLGLSKKLDLAPNTVRLFSPSWRFLNEERSEFTLRYYGFVPSMAPEGHSVLTVAVRQDYRYFHRIYGHKLYAEEEEQVAMQVLEQLERLYPGIAASVVRKDVATPLSYERYTGNWQGASSGWLLGTRDMLNLILGMPKSLPGLHGLFMAGQWVEPGGGVPQCAASGRNAAVEAAHFLEGRGK